MNREPLSEIQTLNRFLYFAANNVPADSGPVGNACFWLTRGSDDDGVITHWLEILGQFTVLFRSVYPSGLHIPIPAPGSPGNIRRYQAGLAEALRLWDQAKSMVLGTERGAQVLIPPPPPPPRRDTGWLAVGSAGGAVQTVHVAPPPPPPPPPRRTPRRLMSGGSQGEPDVTDDGEQDPVTGSATAQSRPSSATCQTQLTAVQTDQFSEAVETQPPPPATTGMMAAPLNVLQEPTIPETAHQRKEQREVTVRSAKPITKGVPVTDGGGPRARWTPDELKAATHAADEIAHLVNGNAPFPGSLDVNTRSALTDAWTRGMTRSEFAAALLTGRQRELKVIRDGINRIQNGGSYFQLLTGLNGVGKSFLLEAAVAVAIEQGLAVAHVEFTAQDRLCDNDGATRGLLTRLLSGLRFGGDSTASGLVQLLGQLCEQAGTGTQPSPKEARKLIEAYCRALLLQPGGEDVVKVLTHYAVNAGDLGRQVKALKWLRAECDSLAEVRRDLLVSSIVGDGDFLRHLTTVSTLCRLAGKRGLLVILDEFSVLVRSLHKAVRQANFDTILNIYNALASGQSSGLGFIFAGTPDCLDPRQAGLLSHPALASRLKHTSGSKGIASSGPILELGPLRPVELFVALQKARRLVLGQDGETRLPNLALEYFLDRCLSPLGAQEFLPPRDVMQGFAALVQTLEADTSIDWRKAIGVAAEVGSANKTKDTNPAFRDLKL